jgi:hypothetical protein
MCLSIAVARLVAFSYASGFQGKAQSTKIRDTPFARTLAKHAMSGCKHSKEAAVGAPNRKPPVMTSSKMTTMPRARHACQIDGNEME